MKQSLTVFAGILSGVLSLTAARADEAAVRKTLTEYVDVFNEGAHEKVAAFWTENGTHTDRETGERTEGREAIEADMRQVLTERSDMKLSAKIDGVRFITPDVATVEGETTIVLGDEEPQIGAFAAILVQRDGKWLIDSIEEMALPQPESAATALQDLEWLIGDWVDDADDTRVTMTFRWSANQAFMIRSFNVEAEDAVVLTGTQVIGWDPRGQNIRSWTFNSDGSFGESIWSQVNGRWMSKAIQTLGGGELASGTYVMEKVDDDSFTIQLVGQELEGEPQPSGPEVTVVRVKTETASDDQSTK